MNYPTHFDTPEVTSADRAANIVAGIVILAALAIPFALAGNADYADELRREQAAADRACRAAGATAAVKIDAAGASIYICNQPRRLA